MKIYHLKPSGDEWELTEEGKEKPVATFSDELTAEGASMDYAKGRRGTLKIFRDDGTVKLILRCGTMEATGSGASSPGQRGGKLSIFTIDMPPN